VVEEGEEVKVVGGGGVAGSEDGCVGNDSFHRLLNDVSSNDSDDNIAAIPKAMFALTDSIKLPSMKDITNEILLSYSDKARDEGSLQYEYCDMHSSNSHRFYLLNGMAGESIDGEPLTLCDLTAVALSTLNAKSRIDAEREVEQDPLFKDFITAAEKKGFFNEKKLNGGARQSAEEEALRQRILYESKYRKHLSLFSSNIIANPISLSCHSLLCRNLHSAIYSSKSNNSSLYNCCNHSPNIILFQLEDYNPLLRYR
jgi:hypothetical protein